MERKYHLGKELLGEGVQELQEFRSCRIGERRYFREGILRFLTLKSEVHNAS
jgi:hypothetical protein